MLARDKSIYDNRYFLHSKCAAAVLRIVDAVGAFACRIGCCRVSRLDGHRIKKILLCRNDHMGDVLMLTTVIKAIRKQLPSAQIHLMISSSSKPLIEHMDGVDRYYFFDHFYLNRSHRSLLKRICVMMCQLPRIMSMLRSEKYDIAIDFRPYFGNVIALLRLAKAKYVIGYSTGGFGFVLDHRVRFDCEKHFINNMFDCVKPITGELYPSDHRMEIICDTDEDAVDKSIMMMSGFVLPDSYVAVHPFSGNSCKMWAPDKWAELINAIVKRGNHSVVVLGAKADEIKYADIARHISVDVVNLVGKISFSELLAVMSKSRMLICVDSLAAHIASALSIKKIIVVATGIQNEVMWKPWMSECIVISKKVDCSPCYRANGCGHMRCIRDVGVEAVYSEASCSLH